MNGADADGLFVDPTPAWLNAPFLDERTEDPGVLAQELNKAIHHWTLDDWSAREIERGTQLFLDEVVKLSPREAFRTVCLRIAVCENRWEPVRSNILKQRLALSAGTHYMLVRLAKEHGESYTEFVRSLIETWAEHHRLQIAERPEMDIRYDPDREKR